MTWEPGTNRRGMARPSRVARSPGSVARTPYGVRKTRQMDSSWEQQGIPNPGSKWAKQLGCVCPALENHYGNGFVVDKERTFWITSGCPLHAPIENTNPL